jgi:hypothetical protein
MTAVAFKRAAFLVCLSALHIIWGCGDEKRASAPIDQEDGGRYEAGRRRDAGKDAGGHDGDSAFSQNDGGGDRSSYQFGKEDWFEVDIAHVERFYDQRGFDIAAGTADFALAFENQDPLNHYGSRIDTVRIPTTGTIPKAKTAVSVDSATCLVATEPALAPYDGGYAAIYSDKRSSGTELYSIRLDASDAPKAITDTESIERHAALTVVNSQLLAAWVTENATTGKRAVYTRLLGEQGNPPPSTVVSEDAGRIPEDLVLTHVGKERAVLGWVDLNQSTRGIYLQRLMSDGRADGEPQQVLSDPSCVYSGSTLDIAGANSGGAIVYAIEVAGAKQVQFMRIDAQGRILPESDVKAVAPPRGQGKDASLTKWGSQESNQYLVAFRAISGEDITTPQIRIMSIDMGVSLDTNNMTYSKIASAAADGGRLTVRVANDGTALVAWVDAELSFSRALRALRLRPTANESPP